MVASAGRDGHRVPAAGRAVRARRPGHEPLPRHHRAQRHARGEPLGQHDDVGHHAEVLGGEHLAGAAHARLHLVEHQQDAVAVAQRAQPRQEVARRHDVAAFAQHRLDDDGRDLLGRRHRREQLLDAGGVAVVAWYTPGSSGPKCLRYLVLLAVSDSEPSVRPWKPPRKAISCGRRVWWRASLIAASTASVPELVRKVCQWCALGADRAARQLAELLAEGAVAGIVEVGAADVDQQLAPAPRSPPRRPGGSGRSTPSPRPPGVEEDVAVDVLDHAAGRPRHHQRVDVDQRRRQVGQGARDHLARARPGRLGHDRDRLRRQRRPAPVGRRACAGRALVTCTTVRLCSRR